MLALSLLRNVAMNQFPSSRLLSAGSCLYIVCQRDTDVIIPRHLLFVFPAVTTVTTPTGHGACAGHRFCLSITAPQTEFTNGVTLLFVVAGECRVVPRRLGVTFSVTGLAGCWLACE